MHADLLDLGDSSHSNSNRLGTAVRNLELWRTGHHIRLGTESMALARGHRREGWRHRYRTSSANHQQLTPRDEKIRYAALLTLHIGFTRRCIKF